MKTKAGFLLAVVMLITCSGCLVAVQEERRGHREHDQRGYDDRNRGHHEDERRDDRRDHDERRY